MKHITDKLDENTKFCWNQVQVILAKRQQKPSTDKLLFSLHEIMSNMLQDFEKSYQQFDMVPPGLIETLHVMLPLLGCADAIELRNALSANNLQDSLVSAMNEVERVKSSLNYVYAGLRFIAALVLTLVVAPVVFVAGFYLGLTFSAIHPVVGVFAAIALASVPTFYTFNAGKDTLMDGVNGIRRTMHSNTETNASGGSFSQFKNIGLMFNPGNNHQMEEEKKPSYLSLTVPN